MHRTKLLTIVLSLALGAAALSGPATAAAAPRAQASAFVTHRGHFWSWAGPRNWHAGYGKQGITILGADDEVLDLGFSSIFCTPAPSVTASVRRYLGAQRRAIARGRTNIVRRAGSAASAGSASTTSASRSTSPPGLMAGGCSGRSRSTTRCPTRPTATGAASP